MKFGQQATNFGIVEFWQLFHRKNEGALERGEGWCPQPILVQFWPLSQ